MKKLFFFFLSLAAPFTIKSQQVDSIIDIRDSQIYKIVKIGQQWWMQENLNIGIMIDSTQNATNNEIIEKYCYHNSDSLCNVYGGLYQWQEMMDYNPSDNGNPGITRGVCLAKWRIPTDAEWTNLTDYLDDFLVAGGKMKETGTTHWLSPNTGATNESGFSALPGGHRSNMAISFGYIRGNGYWWSSTWYNADYDWYRTMSYNVSNVYKDFGNKLYGFSVRCLMDSCQFGYLTISDKNLETISKLDFTDDRTTDTIIIINSSPGKTINITSINTATPVFNLTKTSAVLSSGDSIHMNVIFNPPAKGIYYFDTLRIQSNDPYNPVISVPLMGYIAETDSIIDIRDSHVYKVVKIGQQWWLQENLNIGKRINASQDAADNEIIEKYCYNDVPNNCNIYGGLYPWDEMMDYNPSDNRNPGITRGICPVGWHVSTDNEWTELVDYLGGESIAGGKLKETGTTHWISPNTGATNESGFSALPGGYRNMVDFGSMGSLPYFWSSTEYSSNFAWYRFLHYDYSKVSSLSLNKELGFSVRCLRDSCQFGYLTISDKNLNSVSTLNFYGDNIMEELTLINSGAGKTINISSIYTKNSAFSLNKSSSILLPGDSIHLSVTFDPPVKGIYSDTIYIESNDPYKSLIIIPLFGTFPLEISITDSSNISCFGYSDGSATITPSLGTPPYKYQWDDPGNTTDSTVTGLSPDNFYRISVIDSKGNLVTDSIILSEPEELSILATITDVSITGGSDGIIDISVSGGTKPYNYNWSNDSIKEDLIGIITGEYFLVVKDHNGCIKNSTFRIKEPIHLQFDKVDVSCYGGNDGSIYMTILGGNPPYSVHWSNNAITENIENLQKDRYVVDITDNFGVFVTDTIEIIEPESLSIRWNFSEFICPDSLAGFIHLNPSGGTPPYNYTWSNGANTRNVYNLSGGNYNITITDSKSCENTQNFTINNVIPYSSEKICIVTIDLVSGKNIIVWEKTPDAGISTYNIYRESAIGQYEYIGNRSAEELSIYKDETANPESRSYLYKITVTDTCSNESYLASTPYHWPSFLQYVSSVGGINLSWTDYKIEGIDNIGDYLSSYVIYRGTDSTGLSEYQVVGRQLHFTDKDPDALVRRYYYQVAAILKNPCYPTGYSGKKDEPGPYTRSMSNIEDNRILVGMNDIRSERLSIYPNPFSDQTVLTFNNPDESIYTLYIMDLSGKVCRIVDDIKTSKYIIEKEDLIPGFYFIKLRGPKLYRGKMIVE